MSRIQKQVYFLPFNPRFLKKEPVCFVEPSQRNIHSSDAERQTKDSSSARFFRYLKNFCIEGFSALGRCYSR